MRSYRIGRADSNDIVLLDATVSREHAELEELGGGRFRIKDLGSTYGVSVWAGQDWAKVTESELRHDTQLRLGEYQTTVGDLLRASDQTVVNVRSSEPPTPEPPQAPSDAERTATPRPPRAAPPSSPKPSPPNPPTPRAAPPRPAGPGASPFAFLRDLPPEKRSLIWIGAGFGVFLLIALITLILALAL